MGFFSRFNPFRIPDSASTRLLFNEEEREAARRLSREGDERPPWMEAAIAEQAAAAKAKEQAPKRD